MFRLELNKYQYRSFISYAIATCDSFSLVFEKDNVDKANYVHQKIYTALTGFVLSKTNIGIHPDTKTHFEHSDIVYFKCDKQSGSVFLTTDTVFDWNGNLLPGELCFYRKEKIWCACVCHEERLVVFNATKDDMMFLMDKRMNYWHEM